jgi:hypothetical protein
MGMISWYIFCVSGIASAATHTFVFIAFNSDSPKYSNLEFLHGIGYPKTFRRIHLAEFTNFTTALEGHHVPGISNYSLVPSGYV